LSSNKCERYASTNELARIPSLSFCNNNGTFSSNGGQTSADKDDDDILVNSKTKKAEVHKTNDNFDVVYTDNQKAVKKPKGQAVADLTAQGYSIQNAPEGVGDGAFWSALVTLGGQKLFSSIFGSIAGWFTEAAASRAAASEILGMADELGLKSAQKSLSDESADLVENYLNQMKNGMFNTENGAAGFKYQGQTILTDGNHRMNAAIKYALETGDKKFIDALINNEIFNSEILLNTDIKFIIYQQSRA
jgi:hypothetical protein